MNRSGLLLAVFLLFPGAESISSATGNSSPCTLYKSNNIENARENMKRYLWARDIVEGWKRDTARIMECDEKFLAGMYPTITPWPTYGQNCPACVGRLSSMGESDLYNWTVEKPDQLTCRYCGTVYPNPKFPETGSMTASRMGQTFTFYLTDDERAHPEDKTGKYAYRWASWPVHTSWSGVLRYKRASWVVGQALPLAKLYAVTGETRYAERAAFILDLTAKAYPNWLYHSYNGTYADCPPGEAAAKMGKNPPAGRFSVENIITAFPGLHTKGDYAVLNNGFWGGGRLGCSGTDAGFILNLTAAYDLIRGAKKPDGSPVLSPEAERRIVEDLILAGCADSENYNEINNKCGPNRALSAAVGILFSHPESAHRGLQGFESLMEHSFHFDGFCEESPSYSDMHLSLMRNIPEILDGYSDPAGAAPSDGRTLRNFNPFREVGRYRLALESMVRMLDPNRKYPVIGDTHYGEGISSIYAEILTDRYDNVYAGLLEQAQGASLADKGSEYALWNRKPGLSASKSDLPIRTEWFPGWHVGVLRGSPEADRTALYFNGYAYGGHRHRDTLGIAYMAFGKELASDRGYIWDDPRNAWTRSTLAHNMVTVDGEDQNGEGCHSTLDFFATSPGIEVVQASANAYRQCDEYRRTTALVSAGNGNTYTVDIFRVRGGTRHWYSLNSNGRFLGTAGAELSAASDSIRWLKNVRAAKPSGTVTASWEYEGLRFDSYVLNPIERLLVADAPGWRTNKGIELNAPPIQEIIAERTGTDRLSSRFVAVLAPSKTDEPIVKKAHIVAEELSGDAILIAVEHGGGVDYIASALDRRRHTLGPVTFTGGFGFISTDPGGAVATSFLMDGTELRFGSYTHVMPTGRVSIGVRSTSGSTYRVEPGTSLPKTAKGMCLLAGGTGYAIESVKGDTITVRDYPAAPADSVTVVYSSWKKGR